MRLRRPSHATVVAYAALFMAMSGTAVAASGGTFILGRNNSATSQTRLTNGGVGPVLALGTRPGQAPLAVSPGSGTTTYLSADRVDGLDSSQLQLAIGQSCPPGSAVTGIAQSGGLSCAPMATAASPQPGASPSTAPSPTPSPAAGVYEDKGFRLTDLHLGPDSLGDWDGSGRVTNANDGPRSAGFTVTVFRNGTHIAVLHGSISGLQTGGTSTVQFFTTDDYTPGDYTVTFQTDYSTEG